MIHRFALPFGSRDFWATGDSHREPSAPQTDGQPTLGADHRDASSSHRGSLLPVGRGSLPRAKREQRFGILVAQRM
jgi:hypothetical protein